jgi:sugar/nucleoside kinase (ribokinase family)
VERTAGPVATEAAFDLIAIGETMLRLSVPRGRFLEVASRFDVEVAGPASTVAVAFARLGYQATWVSLLPASSIGNTVANTFGRTVSAP